MMSSRDDLMDQLRKGYGDDPWHGPSIRDLTRDLSAKDAAMSISPAVHTISEIVLHISAWQCEVARRLPGSEPQTPSEGDWPERVHAAEAWEETKAGLEMSYEELLAALMEFPDERLSELVGSQRDRPLGSGVTHQATILGVIQHNSYHGGQIALIRKLLTAT
jgi:uncharacterized damage-inducible protein DinB